MIDSKGMLIIIDFDSCKGFGEKLLSCGTPGWIKEEFDTSDAQHDKDAMVMIEAWLRDQIDGKETINSS